MNHIFLCFGMTVGIFLIVYFFRFFFVKNTTPPPLETTDLSSQKIKFGSEKFWLFIFWIFLVCLEFTKYSLFAFVLHDDRIWIYLSIHICSLPLYCMPILVFSNKQGNVYKITHNFFLISIILSTASFALGADTPNLIGREWKTFDNFFFPIFTYVWHLSNVFLCAYFLFSQQNKMYPKINIKVSAIILIFNFYLFAMSEIMRAARMDDPCWILYNHDMQPIFDWCNKDPYLTNFVVFIGTLAVYYASYFTYYYLLQRLPALFKTLKHSNKKTT